VPSGVAAAIATLMMTPEVMRAASALAGILLRRGGAEHGGRQAAADPNAALAA
jgi:hypothetical protein